MKRPRFSTEQTRADAIYSLASALSVLAESSAPKDLVMLVEHKLRSYLRENECPLCPSCQLEVLLTQTESPAQPASSSG